VSTEDQAQELSAAWQEIVSGRRTRINTAAEDINEIMECARTALQKIVQAIEENPGTGQTGRLVRFLAGGMSATDHAQLRARRTGRALHDARSGGSLYEN